MFAVIMKEIRVLLRSRKAFWFLLLTLLAVGGSFCLGWVSVSASSNMLNYRARMGRQLFMMFSMVQLCAMGLIAPLMAASTVTGERENKTMDLLISTGLSRVKMLLGKWASTIFYELMLLLCLLPVLSLVFQLGGIGLDEYFFAAMMIAVTVLTYGMVGMACSCVFRKSMTALFTALLVILFLSGGLTLLLALLAEWDILDWNFVDPFRTGNPNPPLRFLFWSVSPVLTWAAHLARLEMSGGPAIATRTVSADSILTGHLIVQAVLLLVSLKIAHWGIMRREIEKNVHAAKQIDDPRLLARRRKRWPYYLIDPLRRTQVIADGRNPLYVKEQRVGALARPQVLFRMTYLCVPLSFFLFKSALSDVNRDFAFAAVAFAVTLIMLFVPIFAAPIISREREEKTIDLLATTTLSSSQIVRAKFFIVLRFCAVIALSLTVGPLLLRVMRAADWFSGSRSLFTLLERLYLDCVTPAALIFCLTASFSALYAAACLYFSSTQRRNVSAVVISYITLALLCVLPAFNIIYNGFRDRDWGIGALLKPVLDLLFNGLAPLLSHVHYLTQDSTYNGRHWFVFWSQNSFNGTWGEAALVLLHTVLVLGIAALLLKVTARRLRKETR